MQKDKPCPAVGRLYGVGVGPGDPELLTIRAQKVLQHVPVICVPQASNQRDSIALGIVKEFLKSEQEIVRLSFPTDDADAASGVWREAAKTVIARLEQGQDVAFITEGDPMLYSTFSYVSAGVVEMCPAAPIEIVPGVSSVMAAAAQAQVPLSLGGQRLAILPAVYGIDDLSEAAAGFDTLVLMKVSPVLVKALANLEELGLKGQSTYVRRATTAQERVVRDLSKLEDDDLDYFSVLIVKNPAPD